MNQRSYDFEAEEPSSKINYLGAAWQVQAIRKQFEEESVDNNQMRMKDTRREAGGRQWPVLDTATLNALESA